MSAIEFDINKYDKNKNYVIDASAGTGKTWCIEHIVDKLVSDAEKISLDKILIVTYTEKAAGELKARIRELLKSHGCDVDIDNAPIGTIHSFCNNTLKEFNTYTNQPFQLKLVDDDFMKNKYDETVRSILYTQSLLGYERIEENAENDYKNVKAILSKIYFNDYYVIDESIATYKHSSEQKLILELYKRLNYASDKEKCFIECPKDIDDVDVLKLYKDFVSEMKCLGSFPNLSLERQLYDSIINDTIDNNNVFTYKYKLINGEENITTAKFLKGAVDSTGESKYKTIQTLKSFVEDFKLEKLLYIAKEVFIRWQEEKIKNRWQTYNDMLRSVREGIKGGGKLIEKLREKYDYVIIDEFQDTNQIQWDIFSKVFLEDDNKKIIVVGDFKQSIYAFQGADVYVYKKAREELVRKGAIECCLSKNYRSCESMINAYNELFNIDNFFGEKYNKVECSGKKDPILNGKRQNGLIMVDQNDDPNNFPINYANYCVKQIINFCSKDDDKKTRLQLMVKKEGTDGDKTIEYEPKNVKFGDFAILYRTRSESEHIERALKYAGIPYIKYKDMSLLNGKECFHWITLLKALMAPDFTENNRSFFRKVLFTNFFGKGLDEIATTYFDKDNIPQMQLLLKWKDLLKEKKYELLIDSIIENSGIEQRMSDLGDIQSLTIYKQVGDLILNKFHEGYNIDDIITILENEQSIGDEDEAGNIVMSGTDLDCVQLMTIHAAKGLGFPIVISVAGFKGENPQAPSIYTYHNEDKRFITTNKELTIEKPMGAKSVKIKKVKEEIEDEYKRLFYVAYTRAEDLLIIPKYDITKSVFNSIKFPESMDVFVQKKETSGDKLFDYIHLSVEEQITKHEKDSVQKIVNDSGKTTTPSASRVDDVVKNLKKHQTFKHSYASLSHGETKKEDEEMIEEGLLDFDKEGGIGEIDLSEYDGNSKPVPYNYDKEKTEILAPKDFPIGKEIGTTLHEVFEKIDFTETDETKIRSIIKDCFKNNKMSLSVESEEYVLDMIKNVLSATLPGIKGSTIAGELKLNNIKNEERKPEIEFNFNISRDSDGHEVTLKNYCNGFIDLIFEHDGVYSILDWKSDKKNEDDLKAYSNGDDLKVRVDKHYSIQRVLYSYCLVKWLHHFYGGSEEEIFNTYFGGIYYVFIRGCNENTGNGIYAQTWKSWEDLKKAFRDITRKKMGGAMDE